MFQLTQHSASRALARVLLAFICFFQVFSLVANLPVASAASAPNIISYQGRILNANGIPVTDSTISMIFELYTASSGGSCVWSNSSATCASATSRSVTLTDGLFSEALGDTGSSYAAIGDSIFGDNATLYLQVTVGGEVLSPRKQILAAPYALNSDTLDGLDADTDGSTSSAIVALTSAGNVAFTGDPTGSTVSTGVMYVNPAGAGANETLVGFADNGTDRFRVDKEGDVFIKTIELDGAGTDNVTSGASLIGVYDEFGLSSATTVQDVLDDLDQAVDDIVTGGAVSKWTDGGTFTYLTATTDDLVLGSNAVATASLFFDESAGQLDLGTNESLAGTLKLYSSGAGITDVTLTADATGNLDLTASELTLSAGLTVAAGSGIDTSSAGTLAVGNTTATTVSLCNSAACDTIGIGSNADADSIAIGDVNDSMAITEADWSITGAGVASFTSINATDDVDFTFVTDGALSENLTIGVTHATDVTFSPFLLNFTDSAAADTGTNYLASYSNLDDGGASGTPDGILLLTSLDTNEAVADGIAISSAAGTIVDALDVSDAEITNALNIGANIILGTTGSINFDNFDVDSSGMTMVNPSGNTGTTVDTTAGGALHIENTGNNNYGLTVYSDNGATAASPLAYLLADNTAYDVNVMEIRNDSTATTSSGLVITQNTVENATTTATSQALVINVNETSSSDEVILIVSDADGTPDAEFRFENDGDFFGDGASYNSGADYAEFFYTVDAALGDHEVVCQDLENNLAVKTCGLGDPTVIGVVSTNPGFVGNNIPGAEGSLEGNPNYRVVGLEGQIETYVTAADGAIAVGDALTASSVTEGYAGKATSAGRIIGFALEPMASGSGLMKVRVSPTWHAGDVLDDQGDVGSYVTTLALESLLTATADAPASNSNALVFRGSAWNGSAAQTLAMSLSNKVTDANNYRLSVANTTGAEVAYVNNLGDLVLSGKLYPSNQGTAQTAAYIYYDSNGVGYMRTNAAGWGTGSYDFAEMFPSPEVLTPGDVVVFGDGAEEVKRSTGETYDDRIAGVVSTRPGFLAGTYKPGDSPIALSGRVPTRVNTENGAVAIGDPLTTSSIPGVAMKATEPGPIVGYAMQPLEVGTGMITVFVRASYYDGDGSNVPEIIATPVSEVAASSNLSSLNLSGGPITSVASISGLGNVWRLTETGDLVTRGRLVQVVKSHQNEDVETYAAASREMTIQLSGTATLSGNKAVVEFNDVDPKFNDIISTTAPYRVIATPSGATGQIYVTDRSTSGFTIHADGPEGVLVDWLVIAYHKDYEPVPVAAEEESEDEVIDDVVPSDEEITEPDPEVAGETDEIVPEEENEVSDESVPDEVIDDASEEEPLIEETAEEVPAEEEVVADEAVTEVSEGSETTSEPEPSL